MAAEWSSILVLRFSRRWREGIGILWQAGLRERRLSRAEASLFRRSRPYLWVVSCAVAWLGLIAESAIAAPVTFTFGGTLVETGGGYYTSSSSPLLGTPVIGSTFSGSYTFDSATLDANANPASGNYNSPYESQAHRFTVALGGLTFDLNGTYVITNQVAGSYVYEVGNYGISGKAGDTALRSADARMLLTSTGPWGNGTDALPLVPPLLAEFENQNNGAPFLLIATLLVDGNVKTATYVGNITSINLAAVPLPGALGLLLSAIAGVSIVSWTGHRRRATSFS